jgi:TRAP-type transport system large permease protein
LPKNTEGFSLMGLLWAFKSSILALLMPVIILGGILGGIVTPTEAAAIAVAYALVVSTVVYRAITFQDILEMLIKTARITGIVFLIIAAASILSWWMTFLRLPQQVAALFLSVSTDRYMVITMILALLLFIGTIMDINAALIILAPVLGALTTTIGMDPVHAGIMIVLALNIGLMTPPVGACLFVMCSISGETIERISRPLLPFIIVEVLVLFVVSYWETLTLFVPRVLLGM